MLQGVKKEAHKCQLCCAPDFLQGVIRGAQKCHILFTLKGAMSRSQKCHFSVAPTSFIWCQLRIAAMPSLGRTKGRVTISLQKCHADDTLPTQFNGVIYPARKRYRFVAPQGRVMEGAQKCQPPHALPTQFNGVIVKTQKCLDIVAPRERSNMVRRNAPIAPPLPTSLTGAITTSQKCYKVNAPREGSPIGHSNVIRAAPFPPVTGGHQRHAEMPDDLRPHQVVRTAYKSNVMKGSLGRQHKKENKWTRDTKTQPSQKYSLHGATARTWSEQRAS